MLFVKLVVFISLLISGPQVQARVVKPELNVFYFNRNQSYNEAFYNNEDKGKSKYLVLINGAGALISINNKQQRFKRKSIDAKNGYQYKYDRFTLCIKVLSMKLINSEVTEISADITLENKGTDIYKNRVLGDRIAGA